MTLIPGRAFVSEALIVLALGALLAWPLSRYLAAILRAGPLPGDACFGWIERPLYAVLGTRPDASMTWRGYAGAFLAANAVLAVLVMAILMGQHRLPLNPDGIPGMSWDLALHTMVSFLTNTNQQHYAGQAQLSYLAQMTAITGLQMVTPLMGLGLVAATLRALTAPGQIAHVNVGNFWADVVRVGLRLLLPLCLVWSLLLSGQGVPATLAAGPVATPLDAATLSEQKIPLGPVAPMVAIKQLGTNGGGWYGPNSATALENPTPFSNLLESVAIVLLPLTVALTVGRLTGRPRFGALVFGTMLVLSVASSGLAVWSETRAAPVAAASLEGKEVRLGVTASAVWAAVTTQTSNGSVNAMHDSMAPLTGAVALGNMLVNAIWGGIGCGLQQFLVYLLLAVFLAGLMTGRTPELFGRKIEAPEIRLLAVLVLLQPLVILGLTAATLGLPGMSGHSNPGFHDLSQVFYEYVSAFANNGSGFEGLADNTPWWNVTAAIALAAGRYPALVLPLAIAAMLAAKRRAPADAGSLRVETPTFALTLIAVMLVLTLLQFLPVLVLGPIADHLTAADAAALR